MNDVILTQDDLRILITLVEQEMQVNQSVESLYEKLLDIAGLE